MKIKSSGENQIIINLSKDDLIALEITYDEMMQMAMDRRKVVLPPMLGPVKTIDRVLSSLSTS